MALAEAILVCLTERPMTGYELAKTFDNSIGFFWRAAHQQIYRELQALSRAGYLESEDVIQTAVRTRRSTPSTRRASIT